MMNIFDNILPKLKEIHLTGETVSREALMYKPPQGQIDSSLKEEEYHLTITTDGVFIRGGSEKALFYGEVTLKKLLKQARDTVPCAEIHDFPDLPVRGTHICIQKGHRPTFEQLKKLLKVLADWKVNLLVFENDDGFPWKKRPFVTCPDALTDDQLIELKNIAKSNFIEIAPLFNSFGHAHAYLGHDELAHLRQLPERVDEMCPLKPETMEFVKDMWSDLLDMFPDAKYAHIGGDEVFRNDGLCAECARYRDEDRLAELYLNYYTELSRWIISKGKKPMVWGDMLIKYPEKIDEFPKDITIVDWQYLPQDADYWNYVYYLKRPDGKKEAERKEMFGKYWDHKEYPGKIRPFPYYDFFADKGFEVLGATLAEEERTFSPMPSPSRSAVNNKRFAMKIMSCHGQGFINTYWGMSPIDSSWPGLAAGAEYGWNAANETFDEFIRRFSFDFTGRGENAESIKLMDSCFLSRHDGFYEKSWPEQSPSIQSGKLSSSFPEGNDYAAIQNWSIKVCSAFSELSVLFNRLDCITLGNASFTPLDIKAFLNSNYGNCTPSELSLTPPAGHRKALGVDFNLIDGQLLTLWGEKHQDAPKKVEEIPVKSSPDRLYFLLTGFNVFPDARIAEIKLNFADSSSENIPLLGGDRINEWSTRPLRATLRALPAYSQNKKGIYLTWIDNPSKKEISSLDVISGEVSGHLLLYAITVAENLDLKIDRDELEKLDKLLRNTQGRFAGLLNELKSIYSTLMPEKDIANGLKKTIVQQLNDITSIYLKKIKLLLSGQ